MDELESKKYAEFLDAAVLEAREVERLTAHRAISISDAYRIQEAGLQLRFTRGEKIIGYKMGLTSKAKMKQMGVDSPIFGMLTNAMQIPDGHKLAMKRLIHPKIEPEIAFMVGREIRGEVSRAQALSACESVCAAMEIIDSRFLNFNFTLPDVIADNCSSCLFVLGKKHRKPSEINLGNLGMAMEVNGTPTLFGSSAAIYGHPVDSLVELCKMLGQRGLGLSPGSIVLAGASTQAISIEPGMKIQTFVQDLGRVHLEAVRA